MHLPPIFPVCIISSANPVNCLVRSDVINIHILSVKEATLATFVKPVSRTIWVCLRDCSPLPKYRKSYPSSMLNSAISTNTLLWMSEDTDHIHMTSLGYTNGYPGELSSIISESDPRFTNLVPQIPGEKKEQRNERFPRVYGCFKVNDLRRLKIKSARTEIVSTRLYCGILLVGRHERNKVWERDLYRNSSDFKQVILISRC